MVYPIDSQDFLRLHILLWFSFQHPTFTKHFIFIFTTVPPEKKPLFLKIAQALTIQILRSDQHEITLIYEKNFNFHKNINILGVDRQKKSV